MKTKNTLQKTSSRKRKDRQLVKAVCLKRSLSPEYTKNASNVEKYPNLKEWPASKQTFLQSRSTSSQKAHQNMDNDIVCETNVS